MAEQFIGKTLADKYQIDSLIKEIPPAILYRGANLAIEKPVTIKVLAPEFRGDSALVRDFAAEAKTFSKVTHENILNVTDYGTDRDGNAFIIYDDAGGETLDQIIKREQKFSLPRAINIIKQIAAALSAARHSQIVHQNLTTENVLIEMLSNGSDHIKLMNFGRSEKAENPPVTDGRSIYAAQYSSPEQFAGNSLDERSNVYSLGIIFYEMLAGEAPFSGENFAEIGDKHAQELPAPLSAFRHDLPSDIESVLLTAIAKNPEMRFQNAAEFAATLENTAFKRDTLTQVVPVAASSESQNNIWKTAFIVLAGASLLGAFFIYTTNIKQTDPRTQLQPDANGMPVQPVNPATGAVEQGLANMTGYNPQLYSDANSAGIPGGANPDAGSYNPYWDRGTVPPGAPPSSSNPYPVIPGSIPPGGQQIVVDGNGSVFMQPLEGGYVLVPKNTNTASNVNTQTPRRNANINTGNVQSAANTTVKTAPTPAPTNTAVQPKATPATPTKPAPTPKATVAPTTPKPAANTKP